MTSLGRTAYNRPQTARHATGRTTPTAATPKRLDIERVLRDPDHPHKAAQLRDGAQAARGHARGDVKHVPTPMDSIGIPDRLRESGPYMGLLEKYGISAEAIEFRARRPVAA